ncbi:MAG TPA: response regulator [Aggregatilineales bacterium]|nr:response regulator [Aggregatilineales bacterium]
MEIQNQYNILVVDDDKKTANYLADMLRLLGHTVSVALGPRSAINRLGEVIPDVLFLDINMPGVDGLEICRYLRRDPISADLPIVVVSANEEAAHKQNAFMAGANYYIVKPAMLEDIEKAIAAVLRPDAPVNPGAPKM